MNEFVPTLNLPQLCVRRDVPSLHRPDDPVMETKMNPLNLDHVAVGAPIARLDISFFPIYLPGNGLPDIATGEDSELQIDELDNASMQILHATNPTDKPVLLVEGEHFLGGKQNRALNATVLVDSFTAIELPVSCLEQGRWGRRQEWRRGTAFVPTRIRTAQRAGLARSLQHGSRSGDQGGVWSEIDHMLSMEGVESHTAAAADLERKYIAETGRAEPVEMLAGRGPLPGQCGVVVARGDRIAAMDLFGAPHLLAAHWGQIVRSYYVESAPSVSRPSTDLVLRLVRRFGRKPAREMPGVGLGVERRVAFNGMTGQMLSLNNALVHAAFS